MGLWMSHGIPHTTGCDGQWDSMLRRHHGTMDIQTSLFNLVCFEITKSVCDIINYS